MTISLMTTTCLTANCATAGQWKVEAQGNLSKRNAALLGVMQPNYLLVTTTQLAFARATQIFPQCDSHPAMHPQLIDQQSDPHYEM